MQRWKPHNYQKRAMKFLLDHNGAGLFLDPGLGKTSVALGTLKILQTKGIMRRTLIIAPVRVIYNVWPEQIDEEWGDFTHFKYAILHGPDKEALLDMDADIYFINPEGLEWFNSAYGMRRIKPDTLIVDESTKFKNWSSDRYVYLKNWLPRFQRRWIMTGGPAPNGLLDLFPQMYIADLGRSLGNHITTYRNDHFTKGDYGWHLVKGEDKNIYKKLKKSVLRLSASEYSKLPKRIFQDIMITLPPKARSKYDKMEKDLFIELGKSKHVVTAVNSGVASMKCSQIAGGAVYKDLDKRGLSSIKWLKVHDAKLEAVKDIVSDLQGSPCIILYYFKHELERLLKMLGKKTPCFSTASPKKQVEMKNAWNNDEIPVMLGHPASLGHGLNLQKGSAQHIIFFALTWNYDDYDQVMRRLMRQGNKNNKLIIHRILAKDTVDELQARILNFKGNRQDKLLSALETYKRKRKVA